MLFVVIVRNIETAVEGRGRFWLDVACTAGKKDDYENDNVLFLSAYLTMLSSVQALFWPCPDLDQSLGPSGSWCVPFSSSLP
jgi:hypothetical protein